MYRNIYLLFRTGVIEAARSKTVITAIFGTRASYEDVRNLRILWYLFYFALAYLLPLLFPGAVHAAAAETGMLLYYNEFIWNAVLILALYTGMFLGANVIYELCINENFSLLTMPVTIDDIVYFRFAESVFVILKLSFYLILPFILFVELLAGYAPHTVVLMLLLNLLMTVSFYMLGVFIILWLGVILPKAKAHNLFINMFLASLAVLFLAIQVMKHYSLKFRELVPIVNEDVYNIFYSPAHAVMLIIGSSGMMSLLNTALIILFNIAVIYFLSRLAILSLEKNYKRIHLYSGTATAKKQNSMVAGFGTLNRLFCFLPLRTRTILVKDIIMLVRKPFLILKLLFIVLAIIALSFYRLDAAYTLDLHLFTFYFLPFYIISKLFISAVGLERNNIYFIKQIYTSAGAYLRTRFTINLLASLVLLLPVLAFYIVYYTAAADLATDILTARLISAALCIISSALLVTGFSAYFASFDSTYLAAAGFGITPSGMMILWLFGAVHTFFYYLLDGFITSSPGVLPPSFTAALGIVIYLSIYLLLNLSARKLMRFV